MPRGGGIEKLSSKQASVTHAKSQSWVQQVFSHQIEFIADMAARAGMGGNRNGSAAGVEIVIGSGQPVPFECLFDLPFLGEVFFCANSELLKISAADLIMFSS